MVIGNKISKKQNVEVYYDVFASVYLSVTRSDTTPYAKQNGGPFNFIFNRRRGFALPDDQVTEFRSSIIADNSYYFPIVFRGILN